MLLRRILEKLTRSKRNEDCPSDFEKAFLILKHQKKLIFFRKVAEGRKHKIRINRLEKRVFLIDKITRNERGTIIIGILLPSRQDLLTLSWPGKILLRPKIRCFNFKPQYLLNYTSPTNDLYSVRKRSIRALKSIFKLLGWGPASARSALAPNFAPKLCTRRVSACFSTCFKTCWGRFDPMLIPVG